jgi:hypothetical protein
LPSDKPIQRYVAGMEVAAFGKDQRTCDAVERCLERIGGAAAKPGDLDRPLCRVSLGRENEGSETVCIAIDLPPLRAACEKAFLRLSAGKTGQSSSRTGPARPSPKFFPVPNPPIPAKLNTSAPRLFAPPVRLLTRSQKIDLSGG